jgi:hypothetical protein
MPASQPAFMVCAFHYCDSKSAVQPDMHLYAVPLKYPFNWDQPTAAMTLKFSSSLHTLHLGFHDVTLPGSFLAWKDQAQVTVCYYVLVMLMQGFVNWDLGGGDGIGKKECKNKWVLIQTF